MTPEHNRKPTTIFLIRHGQTPTTGKVLPGRAPGLHLSEVGLKQAKRVAERIGSVGKDKVAAAYTSPMERTQETAAPIGDTLGIGVTVDDGLLEADFGSWTGQELKDLMKLPEWSQVQSAPSGFRFPDGESFAEMQFRITSTLQRLSESHRGDAIVVVSHADPIKAAVADAMGVHLDLFQRIVIGQCSVSAIQYSVSSPIVLSVNSMGDDLKQLIPS